MSDYPPSYRSLEPPPARGGSGCVSALTSILLVLIGGAIFLVVFFAFGFYKVGEGFIGKMEGIFAAPQPTPVVDARAVIVKQVRQVSELTTALYGLQTVTDASKDRTLGPFTIGRTKLLYVAYGEVRAGVDLAELTPEDVQVISDTVIITLPPPRLLDKKIDVERSYVYDYQESFFAPPSPELQSWAEQYALVKIVEAACEQGVLETANEKAKTAVETLLELGGYRSVTVVTRPPRPENCQPAAPPPTPTPVP